MGTERNSLRGGLRSTSCRTSTASTRAVSGNSRTSGRQACVSQRRRRCTRTRFWLCTTSAAIAPSAAATAPVISSGSAPVSSSASQSAASAIHQADSRATAPPSSPARRCDLRGIRACRYPWPWCANPSPAPGGGTRCVREWRPANRQVSELCRRCGRWSAKTSEPPGLDLPSRSGYPWEAGEAALRVSALTRGSVRRHVGVPEGLPAGPALHRSHVSGRLAMEEPGAVGPTLDEAVAPQIAEGRGHRGALGAYHAREHLVRDAQRDRHARRAYLAPAVR